MQLNIRHKCHAVRRDITVRLQLTDALRQPICPKCKKSITVPWWQKLHARSHGAKASSTQERSPILRSRGGSIKEFSDLRVFLERFGAIAWTHNGKLSGNFVFSSKAAIIVEVAHGRLSEEWEDVSFESIVAGTGEL